MSVTQVPGVRVPIRLWADPAGVEPAAMQQLRNISSLPWIAGLAVMPDVHLGKGATVGSVIAMRDAVCPAAVGVDIGCGMSAVRTSVTTRQLPDDLSRLRSRIERAIPVGRGAHKEPVDPARLPGFRSAGWSDFWQRFDGLASAVKPRRERAAQQMGSLGSGNHFVEVCTDGSGRIWLMLHSGSRNIGKELAEHHIGVARSLPHNQHLTDRDLAVFIARTPQMEAYRRDLYWAQEYARLNRAAMMSLFKNALRDELRGLQVEFEEEISCHHNYVAEEEYDGEELLVTRKGAISARAGEYGIIPGSMGTSSYIVRGLGNPESFHSASHGAGRRMSRGAAKRRFTRDDLVAQTRGVECRKDSGVIDEIPGAYKDIDQVIADQTDLVEVVAKLRQLVCVKG
ncbi:RtcB family protein [Phaeacidiphilus oryzae]|uniref:RtcB family protein n=1 Tax=Phaeacidiphilus oryzae TaxID=348818 RepID=UPI00056C1FC2|nr:RtcB family protein [Phaeacidiphilus oryzae]